MTSFELSNIGGINMGGNIKLKIAENAQTMIFAPTFVAGVPLSSDAFKGISYRIFFPNSFFASSHFVLA